MIFARVPLADAVGAVLAHTVALGDRTLAKGVVLGEADVSRLRAAGLTSVVAARLAAADVPEDQAAAVVAAGLAGPGVNVEAAFTGRCNLHATERGLAVVDRAAIDAMNRVDEAITVATVPPYDFVEPGQLLATVKIIPFSAPTDAIESCRTIAAEAGAAIRVVGFRRQRAGLVLTKLPQTKPSVIEKTIRSTADRLQFLGSRLGGWVDCPHDEAAVAACVKDLLGRGLAPVLVCGATAIVDRADVVPAGIVRAGGVIDHFGMPVDPGNLILLAHCGETPVICLPGCARSPKFNGFDFVLRRVLAGLPVGRSEIADMGVGGLLKEIVSRPAPREAGQAVEAAGPRAARIAGIVLAAGRSSRMGSNKLLEIVGGKPMLLHVVDAVLASAARPVVVVTGHQSERIEALLVDRDVRTVHNPDFAQGLSTSLRTGLSALPKGCDGAVVCLADMPRVGPGQLDRLIAAFNPAEGRAIIVPTHGGRRGNPVLWAAQFFGEMSKAEGDAGARHLIGEHRDQVREVPIDDPAVLTDVDTPQALADLRLAADGS